MSLLEVANLHKHFMGNVVLEGLSLDIDEGESVGLIGPNGAGKTTLVNILTGFVPPDGGSVHLAGERIDQLKPYQVSRRGVRRTFQLTRNFERMSVLDNLLVAAAASGVDRATAERRAEVLLEELALARVAAEPAEKISGGQQKLLEIAGCFIVEPKFVILDEPFAAIHPQIKKTISDYVVRRRESGQTFLLVSHDIPAFRGVTERLVAMGEGRVLADGPTEKVVADPFVADAFLGGQTLSDGA